MVAMVLMATGKDSFGNGTQRMQGDGSSCLEI